MAKPIIVRLYNPPVLPMMFGIATIPQMVGSVLGLPPYSCFFPSNHPILRNLPSNPIFRCQFKFTLQHRPWEPSFSGFTNLPTLAMVELLVPDAPVTRSKSCQRASCGDHVGCLLGQLMNEANAYHWSVLESSTHMPQNNMLFGGSRVGPESKHIWPALPFRRMHDGLHVWKWILGNGHLTSFLRWQSQ